MSDQPKKPCFAADGKEPIINAGFGYPLMVSAVAFNRQHSRIEADEALMRQMLDALEDITNGWKYIRSMHGDLYGVGWDRAQDKADAAITALRKRLESSNDL